MYVILAVWKETVPLHPCSCQTRDLTVGILQERLKQYFMIKTNSKSIMTSIFTRICLTYKKTLKKGSHIEKAYPSFSLKLDVNKT